MWRRINVRAAPGGCSHRSDNACHNLDRPNKRSQVRSATGLPTERLAAPAAYEPDPGPPAIYLPAMREAGLPVLQVIAKVSLRSSPNLGTLFTLSMPRAPAADRLASGPSARGPSAPGPSVPPEAA